MATSNSAIVTSIYQSIAGGLAPPASDVAVYTAALNSGWTQSPGVDGHRV